MRINFKELDRNAGELILELKKDAFRILFIV